MHRLASPILWPLPLAFAALLSVMLWVSLPLWQVFNLDPDYYYLLNGLRMVEGLAPTDLSHPGTPVQAIIAAVLRLMHPGEGSAAIVDQVLKDPERHLIVATLAFYPFVALALVSLGAAVLAATGSRTAALVAQSSPFLSAIIAKFGLHAKPEPLIIAAAAALAALGFAAVRTERPGDRMAGLFGLVMGFGIACKLQFAALGLLPLFLLPARQLFVVYPLATIAAFFVFVSPALPSADLFFDLWGRILTHSGAYGTGEAGIVNPTKLPRAILKLFSGKWLFTLVIVVALALLVFYFRLRRRGLLGRDRMARLAAGLVLAQVATVVMIAKQPASHYMIPALMLTGPTLVTVWSLSRPLMGETAFRRLWLAVPMVLAVIAISAAWRQTRELDGWTKDAQGFDMSRFAGCAKIGFDASSSLGYALQRGDMNAQGRYSPKLAAFMPRDEYFWFTNDHTWWNRSLMQWNQPVRLTDILARHGCAVLRGSQPWTLAPELAKEAPGLVPDDRCSTSDEEIFTINVRCDGSKVAR
ncbi:conserved membrane hypothetical protein [Magnetospirillum sp. LM-5]|uniref:hypothetical protein n=1 Tax=Magnetospirillum sp. LM-5 TaxID=2681466 RepID=UPI001383DD48|nr:hypothetical protein [Magnetospirillum sp. LM-5]CAA7620342.1 conserved membrane hypothetical protein [Magnetospirillum sp. LM-5]